MASQNIILPVPGADSSVDYKLPANESAKLNITAQDIDGLKLDGHGGLVISLAKGGEVTISNFESFINSGNTLALNDGTQVDPKTLFSVPAGPNDAHAPANDTMKIGTADEAAAHKVALSTDICTVDDGKAITKIQQLAQTNQADETLVVIEEEKERQSHKSKIAAADMNGKEDIGPGGKTGLEYKADHKKGDAADSDATAKKLAEIKTAAGGDDATAKHLANIETAAGGAGAGAGGRANSGYGYNSRPGSDPFVTNPDIGPINPTALAYQAPLLAPSQILTINAQSLIASPDVKSLDETNLAGGPISVSGTISIDFGADGNGGIAPNGTFSSGGSQTGGALTSNGDAITVAVVNNTYVGTTPGGDKVFELKIDNVSGDYKFIQYLPLDHADGSNPNDQISLVFGVTAKDGDGDTISTTVTIVVLDDAPSISGATGTVDETNLGPTATSGFLTINYGQDGPGHIESTGTFAASGSLKGGVLTSNGIPVIVTSTPTGYEGKAGTDTVFTLTLDPATGAFSYTLFKNIDHADINNPDDVITLTFGAKIIDFDGDSAIAPIVINVHDDGPTFQTCNCGPTPPAAKATIDETDLKSGAIVETGQIIANFGADKPGTYGLKDGVFVAGGSLLGGNLTHDGVPVVVSIEGGHFVGKAGGVTIFTLELNTVTGDYKFTLLDNLDHADATNPDDEITLEFGVTAKDFEGDSTDGTIRITVKDDAPIANDDSRTTTDGATITGNVTTNDVPGQDTPATVTQVVFNGATTNVPASGDVSIVGAFGTLTINSTGAYTYVAKVNVDGTDDFTYTLKDHDGDTDPAILSIAVNDNDTIPIIAKPADEIVDETNLASGVITETGTVTGNFFTDGPGTFAGNNSFTSGGSRLGGALTSGGVAVVVTQTGDTYTGVAGGVTVFTMQVNANGSYTFKLLEQLDHADGNDANDIITLDFGVKATDADGDSAATTITVQVKDDAPIANDDSRALDDGATVTGNVTSNDVTGQDTPATVTKVAFNGVDHAVAAVGNTTIAGTFGTLTINSTGAYTYVAKVNIDGTDNFTYTLKDNDGDTDPAILSIKVNDTDTIPTIIKPADEIVDETNLASGVITETGTVTANFFTDGPGTFAGNNSFTSGGSRLGGALTSGGVAVVVTQTGDTYTGTAGGVTVFTMQVSADGSYTFKLLEQLDHADGNDANDIITLNFGVKATDADGDSAVTTVTVQVKDDAPIANDDGRTSADGATITGNVTTNDVPGQDTPATVTKVVFNGATTNVPASGDVSIVGVFGTLTINSTGAYTYVAKVNTDGTDNFSYTLKDNDGDTDPAVLSITVTDNDTIPTIIKPADEIVDETNLASGVVTETGTVTANFFTDGPGTFAGNNTFTSGGSRLGGALTSGGVAVVVTQSGDTYTGVAGGVTVFTMQVGTNGSYTFKLLEQLDHADGSDANDIITLNFGVKATDADGDSAATTITVQVKDDAPIANDDGRTTTDGSTITGNVTTNDVVGQDTPGAVTKVSFNGVDHAVASSGNTTIAGTYGTLTIDSTGVYTYVAKVNAGGTDNFTYTLKDNDGDTDPAILSITVNDNNTIPTIIKPTDEIVDETNLASGVITETGTVTANFFTDGPGTFAGNNSFTSGGSRLGDTLTSGGVAVVVTQTGDTYTGTAGGVTVFTMQVNTNGSYTFKLLEQLDHADGNDANDIITLNFGVKATDADGDSAATTITVQVKDDAPIANDDTRTIDDGVTITGNVTLNDVSGQDTPATVTKIALNGIDHAVAASGNTTIVGDFGTLTINSAGVYTYVAKVNTDGTDNFTYTLRDRDGDTDPAILSICVQDTDTTPLIIKPADEVVDETNLASGVITETGTVTANFFTDGPGAFAGNNTFTSGGSRLGGALTSGGVAVVVSQTGNTYTGVAGGVTVFTMQVDTNGSYTFKLLEQLDHADGNDPNDIITLNFGVKATDADGDSAATTVTVQVKDDAPIANDETIILNENSSAIGNVTANDVPGQDTPAVVTKIVFNGVTTNVPVSGDVSIAGAYGTLTINSTGAYTYVAGKINESGVDNFTYTLKDRDGDSDPAVLSVCVNDVNTIPVIAKPTDGVVDETNLASGVVMQTGTVSANFFTDGPGTIAGNNTFTSGGSRLGGVLTSAGAAVSVTQSGDTYTGIANGMTIFTMQILATGAYAFKLFEQLDHADGTNPNDMIALNFGVKATDADGDTAATAITVQVQDDAPIAHDDYCTLVGLQTTISSNALTNDIIGQDITGKVTAITFGGVTTAVPGSGLATIESTYGTLTMAANGAYTFKVHSTDHPITSEAFTVTISDHDGDTANSLLQINLAGYHDGIVTGTAGNDSVTGTEGNDIMYGNDGNDWLYGMGGNDYLEGNAGNDIMTGDAGNDVLYGGAGNDDINGGTGNDDIIGQAGNDVLTGGAGSDTFWYLATNEGVDHIKDFSIAEHDKLEFSNVLVGFDPVTDAINNFVFATHSGNDTIISVNATGVGGEAAATQMIVLDNVNVSVSDLFNNGSIIT